MAKALHPPRKPTLWLLDAAAVSAYPFPDFRAGENERGDPKSAVDCIRKEITIVIARLYEVNNTIFD